MKLRWLLLLLVCTLAFPTRGASQDYEILAVRYGSLVGFPLRGLLPDAPEGEAIDAAMSIWVVRNDDRIVLLDTGFFREQWFDRFDIQDFVRPDDALRRIGIEPDDVTDIVVSHAHWDHMGGVALFPNATVWIQEAEYTYYTGAAWQPGAARGGIDRDDVAHLVERNLEGTVRLVNGDEVEILPGITVHTGSRHTYASQYISVAGQPRYVLASDNAYLYRNLDELRPSATFTPEDRDANVAQIRRMLRLAGDSDRVVPGHDAEVFRRFPRVAEGVVRIKR